MAAVIRADYRERSGIFDTPKRPYGQQLCGVCRLNRFKRRREFEPGIPKPVFHTKSNKGQTKPKLNKRAIDLDAVNNTKATSKNVSILGLLINDAIIPIMSIAKRSVCPAIFLFFKRFKSLIS